MLEKVEEKRQTKVKKVFASCLIFLLQLYLSSTLSLSLSLFLLASLRSTDNGKKRVDVGTRNRVEMASGHILTIKRLG